jgi:hypothetical protein
VDTLTVEEQPELSGQIAKWLAEYGSWLLYGVSGIAFLLLLLFRFSSGGSKASEMDYVKADVGYLDFRYKGDEAGLESLRAFQLIYPELEAKYGGKVSQLLLARDRLDLALPLAGPFLDKNQSGLSPVFLDFSKGSLVLDQEDGAGSFETSHSSSEVLRKGFPVLSSFVLLRESLIKRESGEKVNGAELSQSLTPQVATHLQAIGIDLSKFF